MKETAMKETGLIFDIKRYAVNDGPGIRTTVFFKGCPLSCGWCHNPESRSEEPQLIYYRDKCIGCQFCIRVCPIKAITLDGHGVAIDMDKCTACGNCTKVCPTEALELAGTPYTIDQVMTEILKDRSFFEESNGGVTFSGGEPVQQIAFLLPLLKLCQENDISTAVDTTGYVPIDHLLEIMPFTDLFLYDLKHMDSQVHEDICGVTNHKIIDNLKTLSDNGARIHIRIPIIPGINDDANIQQTADFVRQLNGIESIDLLPYHNIMTAKYERLNMSYLLADILPPDPEELNKIKNIFEAAQLSVTIGG